MNIDDSRKKFEAELKKKSFLTFHEDGFIDILMGWNLIVIGVSLHLHNMSIVSSIIALAPMAFFYFLKTKITLPRLGHAQFRTRRTPSMWLIGGIGGIFILTALIDVFFLNSSIGIIRPIALVIFGIAFVMVLISGFNRILAYVILVPLYFVVGFGLRFLSPIMIIGTGVILMVVGIWMLVKFIQTYPIQAGEGELV